MAFNAYAEIGSEKFVVEQTHFGLSRKIAPDGMVSSGFQQSLVNLTVRVTEGSKVLGDQINNQYKPIAKVKITFDKATEKGQSLQVVELTNAYLVDVRQEFNANNDAPLLITYTFSCQELAIDDAVCKAQTDWSKI